MGVALKSGSSGTYGAPLLDGCQWATWVARCQNLTVYGNGNSFDNSACGPPNGCTFGPEFQCTELAQRYAYYAWNEPANWYGYGGNNGAAYQFWDAAPALPIPLQRFAQGGGVPPQQGDLLIFGPGWLGTYWDGNGHVAVVSGVGSNYVDIVQENGTASGRDRLTLSGTTVLVNGYTPVIGWLHNNLLPNTAGPGTLGVTRPARVLDTRVGQGAAGPVGARGTVSLHVVGVGGVPSTGVGAVVLNVTVTETGAAGYLTVWPDGVPRPVASSLNFAPGQTVPNLVITPVGADGQVNIYNGSGASVQVVADVSGWFSAGLPPAGGLTPLTPARVLDTRVGQGAAGPVTGGATASLQVLGVGGVPSIGVSAVVLNVTATEPQAPGYLTVWPDGSSRPLASNLNFTAGQTVPNLVIAPVGPDGKVDIYNGSGAAVQVIADVSGWFSAGVPAAGGLAPLTPARVLDTRVGQGAAGPVAGGGTVSLQVLGVGGVPSTGVSAVVLNVTATDPAAVGYLTAWPDGVSRPLASNLNFTAGQTVPNLVVAPVGADGKVDIYNGSGATVQVVADVSGWFSSGLPAAGGLAPLTPARLLDTTVGQGAAGPLDAGGTLALHVLGVGGVPSSGVGAVVLNVTVTEPGAVGYLTVWPDGVSRPLASNLNFTAGQTVPNLVITPVGTGGKVDIYNGSGASVQVIADVSGWFSSGAPAAGGLAPLTPARVLDTTVGQGATGPVAAGGSLAVQVLGVGGVPSAGVSAVVVNVTATEPGAAGYLTVWSGGASRPLTSNVNFTAGQTVPNLVVAPVGADGKVNIYNGSAATVHVIADVSGWFSSGAPAAGGLAPLTSARVLDTTVGQGATGPVAAGGTVALQVLGVGGVPSTGVGAVVLNVTVTQPQGAGYLTVWPDGVSRPLASNLNFTAGQTVPNLVIAPVGADGKVAIYNGSGATVQVIADVAGYLTLP